MYTNPIAPDNYIYPPYLWPQVVAVLEAQGLPYLPSMAPIFVPNDPFAAFHYPDGRHSLNGQRGIEMPWQTMEAGSGRMGTSAGNSRQHPVPEGRPGCRGDLECHGRFDADFRPVQNVGEIRSNHTAGCLPPDADCSKRDFTLAGLGFLRPFCRSGNSRPFGHDCFSKQANKVLSKWHGRRFLDEIQTANTHPEK